jgi:hypothetical protein
VQSSRNYDATFEAAIRIEEKQHKIQLVDDTIEMVGDDLADFLRMGVCYGLTFEQLKGKGMPCERDKYYLMRRKFYYELSRRI